METFYFYSVVAFSSIFADFAKIEQLNQFPLQILWSEMSFLLQKNKKDLKINET